MFNIMTFFFFYSHSVFEKRYTLIFMMDKINWYTLQPIRSSLINVYFKQFLKLNLPFSSI